MKYFEEAKAIWKKYVPQNGQSETVEGELIRAIEKLRYEAQNNGNANWDVGFVRFCDYIWDSLNDDVVFKHDELKEIKNDVDELRNSVVPVFDDEFYDRIIDRVIEWGLAHNGPIKRERDPLQYR